MIYRSMMYLAGAVASSALLACHPTAQATPAPTAPSAQASGSAPNTAPPGAGGIRRTLIDHRPATGLPGWETQLYLIEFPPGVVAPPHTHPAVGVGLVLDGRFESAFGDEPVV